MNATTQGGWVVNEPSLDGDTILDYRGEGAPSRSAKTLKVRAEAAAKHRACPTCESDTQLFTPESFILADIEPENSDFIESFAAQAREANALPGIRLCAACGTWETLLVTVVGGRTHVEIQE